MNTTNPYRMDAVFEQLTSEYGVEGDMNEDLEMAYMQGDGGNLILVSILFILLISFIFAIFGIGIVRNSIQLSNLEQIKDYGNLRCIGATKGQLKPVVYLEGMILELTGNAIGMVTGLFCSMAVGALLGVRVGFHLVPVVPILIAFLGDLFFAMEETCKVIVNLTPVSAIRGEYRIHKEKLKRRGNSLFGKLFGVEGEYAYKSILRNPGRFLKTVWAMGLGIAACIAVMSIVSTANGLTKQLDRQFRYYKISYEHILGTNETIDEVQSSLPSRELFQRISDMDEVGEAKRIYSSMALLVDWEEHYAHYTDTYLDESMRGAVWKRLSEIMRGERAAVSEESARFVVKNMTELACYGYDEEDYARLGSALEAGTLDISENGVVLINGSTVMKDVDADSEEVYLLPGYDDMEVPFNDYQVGDTVSLVDMTRFRNMMEEELSDFRKRYQKEHGEWQNPEEAGNSYQEAYDTEKMDAAVRCRQRLIGEGAFRTYTIEGIVSRNENYFTGEDEVALVLPLERYYDVTGTDESMMTGMQYHFDRFPVNKFMRIGIYETEEGGSWFGQSLYLVERMMLESFKLGSGGVMVFVVFVVMMTTFNIINTTASNLHLRKKELAQLRVIGVSKRQLMKMLMLEGVITSIVANGIGMILGTALNRIAFGRILGSLLGIPFRFPFGTAILGIVLSTLILCGSVYVPLKGLKSDMAGDLATGGE